MTESVPADQPRLPLGALRLLGLRVLASVAVGLGALAFVALSAAVMFAYLTTSAEPILRTLPLLAGAALAYAGWFFASRPSGSASAN